MANSVRVALADDDTVIELAESNSEFPRDGGVVQIEDEKISYAIATDRQLLGCTRGILGTSAAVHDSVVVVTISDKDYREPMAVALVEIVSAPSVLPMLSDAAIAALTAPSAGLVVYSTDSNKLNLFNGTAWEVVTSAVPEA